MLDKMVDFLNHILLQDREGVSSFFLERSMPASQELGDEKNSLRNRNLHIRIGTEAGL